MLSSLSVGFCIPHALGGELLSTLMKALDSRVESFIVSLTDDEGASIDRQSKGPEVIDDVGACQQSELKEVNDSDNGLI
jgi:hypothetical protein